MISDIENIILHSVDVFLETTAKEFDIPLSKLKENWRDHLGRPPLASKKGSKKSSLYQNFFVKKRSELLEANANLPFGELSSQISRMWKSMTKEEQQVYGAVAETVENEPPVVHPPESRGFDFESLNKKTMPELRKLCEEKGLRRTGNKVMLINNLLGEPPKEVEKPSVVVKRPLPEDTEDVEVVMAKNMKRADIEEEDAVVSFLEDEEGNFEFEEGSNYSISLEDDE